MLPSALAPASTCDMLEGTEDFNRVQSRLASEQRSRTTGSTSVALVGLLRVLIADDDRDMTDALSRLVRIWGHDARWAYDGATALEMAVVARPDVLLLDIALPRIDGYQLAKRFRGNARLRNCFLIAVTGSTDEARRRRSREAGIDLFLIKPVAPPLLETLLLLERERLGRSPLEAAGARGTSTMSGAAQWGRTARTLSTAPCGNLRTHVHQ